MTLRRKMGCQITAMIVGLLLVSATGLWGLNGLRTDYRLALDGYDYIRQGFEVGAHLKTARTMLGLDPPQRATALHEAQLAKNKFQMMVEGSAAHNHKAEELHQDQHCVPCLEEALDRSITQLKSPPGQRPLTEVVEADDDAVDAALGGIISYTADIRSAVESYQHAADAKRRTTLSIMAAVCAAVVTAGVVLGMLQYLGVIGPLRGLSAGVKRVAAGKFTDRLPVRGSNEFSALAGDFNRMAEELDGFYHQLEEKVAEKSNQLVRSERLASVGYLAAGVAHEINNPLGIIAGYAEYSLEQVKRQAAEGRAAGPDCDLEKSLQVICDEAFRCKDITVKLLSLARQGDESRETVCLPDVADKVVSIIRGLREYRDRSLMVATAGGARRGDLCVLAVEAQMQQVVLNLTLNALQATAPNGGEVRVELARRNGSVELSVADNGRGMPPHVLEHVFEPFFTEKRGAQQAGTGLGLSITHRIVQSHGGTIAAHSAGAGRGSRFIVALPATASSQDPADVEEARA